MALKIGDKLVLTITDVAFGGEGVGRVDDFVVFVPFVIDGEEVEAEVTEVKQRFARARLLRVVAASPDRVDPVCRHFAACGGCQYQHIAYARQLAIKQKQIASLFERIGEFAGHRIEPVIRCPQPYGYRNRVMIRSQWNKPAQKLNIGFVRWDGGLVEDIDACSIAEAPINEQIRRVWENPPPKGGLKVVLRIPPADWDVPPDSFFQNNFFLLPKLVETVRQVLREGGARHLIDLYCGVGFFGIELAAEVESFVGVEYDRRAIESARRNAASHGAANGEFISATVEEALPALVRRFSRERTTVLIDPPRKGVQAEVIEWLRRERPARIIYVSCHPATMARDLNALCREGVFSLARVIPLDMFPQTQHVECVAEVRCGAD